MSIFNDIGRKLQTQPQRYVANGLYRSFCSLKFRLLVQLRPAHPSAAHPIQVSGKYSPETYVKPRQRTSSLSTCQNRFSLHSSYYSFQQLVYYKFLEQLQNYLSKHVKLSLLTLSQSIPRTKCLHNEKTPMLAKNTRSHRRPKAPTQLRTGETLPSTSLWKERDSAHSI